MNTDKITQYLEQMAAKLGVAAEHVYGVLVRQSEVEGTVLLVVAGIAFLIFVVSLIAAVHYWDDDFGFPASLCVLVFGVGTVLFGTKGLLLVLNPEYYAIREIMDVIGGATR